MLGVWFLMGLFVEVFRLVACEMAGGQIFKKVEVILPPDGNK